MQLPRLKWARAEMQPFVRSWFTATPGAEVGSIPEHLDFCASPGVVVNGPARASYSCQSRVNLERKWVL